jgi:hypothetical protein
MESTVQNVSQMLTVMQRKVYSRNSSVNPNEFIAQKNYKNKEKNQGRCTMPSDLKQNS